MNRSAGERDLLYRDALSLTLGGTLMLFFVMVLLLGMSWRSMLRWEPLDRNLEKYERLEQDCRRMGQRLADSGRPPPSPATATVSSGPDISGGVAPVASPSAPSLLPAAELIETRSAEDGALMPERPQARTASSADAGLPEACAALEGHSMRVLGVALGEEVAAQHATLQELKTESQREFRVALFASGLIPLVAAGFWLVFNRRVLRPLGELGSAMSLVARKDYRTVKVAGIDPAIRPLLDKYNRMVGRIQDLEAARRKREEALRRELEDTVRGLLKQHAVLARSDRLAALGDMTARMAHRLRSPLSAVLVTLTNLCAEPVSPDQRERLRRSIEALERSFRELTALAAEAHQDPEPAVPLVLSELVDDVLALARNLSDGLPVVFDNRVPQDMVCPLPEAGTRHALMTLVNRAVEGQRDLESGAVTVEARCCGERVCISVQDRGSGFDAAEIAQSHRGASLWSRRGAAMGLAVVGRFADYLGGELELVNLPGGGARATLSLPAQVAPAARLSESGGRSRGLEDPAGETGWLIRS